MKQVILIETYLVVLFSIVFPTGARGQDVRESQTPGTSDEFRKAIREVLQETETPAAGVAGCG